MLFLILFAIFVATVLFAIVLERVFRLPELVAITFFSLYLIVLTILFAVDVVTDFAIGVIAVIIFAVIAYITAWIVRFLRCICRRFLRDCCTTCPRNLEGNQYNETDIGFEPENDENNVENNYNCTNTRTNSVATLTDNVKLNNNFAQDNRIRKIRNSRYRRF